MAKLPFKKRMQDALQVFGTKNGTKIEDGTPPEGTNDLAAWQAKHDAVRDALRFKLMKDVGEKGYEKAKEAILQTHGIDKSKLVTGHDETLVVDNVACNLRVQAGRSMLNREKLLVVLTTKHKLSMEDALSALDEGTVMTSNALYFTPSLVRE